MHRDYALLRRCEDTTYAKSGLTMEQFSMLVAMKYIRDPVRPTDVAEWIGRSPNSVSMLVDRMVKAGLVTRKRDRRDRRVVRVSLTGKGEKALKPATPAGWEFIQKILSPLSYKDKHALASMLEIVKCELLGYLNPEVDMAEIVKNSVTNQPGLYERMVKNVFPSGSEAKRQGGKKKKAIG
jgi:DNA-binding MarR family transcriptional regulator